MLKKFSTPKRREVDNQAMIYYYTNVYKNGRWIKSIINMSYNPSMFRNNICITLNKK